MNRFFKFIGIFIGVAIAVLVLAYAAVRFYFPPAKMKTLILAEVAQRLDREVRVGDVSLHLVSGITLSQVAVSEPKTFAQGTFLTAERFSFYPALRPLLHKQLIISRADLQGASVTYSSVTLSALNLTVWNVSMEKAFPFDGNARAKAPGFQGTLALKGVLDWPQGHLKLQKADVSTKEFVIGAVGNVERLKTDRPSAVLDLTVKEFHHPALKVPLKGTVHLEGTADRVAFQSLKASLGALEVAGHGRVEKLSGPSPVLNAHVETNPVSVMELMQLAAVKVPSDLKLSGPLQAAADVSGNAQSARVAAKIQAKDLDITKGTVFKKPAGLPMDLQVLVERQPAAYKIGNLQARVGSIQAAGSGLYKTTAGAGDIDFKLKTNTFPLAEVVKLSPAWTQTRMTLGGTGSLDLALRGRSDALSAQGTLLLVRSSVKTPDTEVSGADGRITFQSPSALADVPTRVLKTSGQLKVTALRHTYYHGQNAALEWNLSDVTEDLSRVSGDAKMTQGAGNLLNADKLAAQSKTARLFLQPVLLLQKFQAKGLFKQIGLPSFENIPFSALSGIYAFRSGTLVIQPFDLTGQDVHVQTKGTVALAGRQPLDLRGTLELRSDAIRGTVGQILKSASLPTTIPYTVTGTVEQPNMKLELGEIVQKGVEGLLKNPDVKELGDKLLKQIFKN